VQGPCDFDPRKKDTAASPHGVETSFSIVYLASIMGGVTAREKILGYDILTEGKDPAPNLDGKVSHSMGEFSGTEDYVVAFVQPAIRI